MKNSAYLERKMALIRWTSLTVYCLLFKPKCVNLSQEMTFKHTYITLPALRYFIYYQGILYIPNLVVFLLLYQTTHSLSLTPRWDPGWFLHVWMNKTESTMEEKSLWNENMSFTWVAWDPLAVPLRVFRGNCQHTDSLEVLEVEYLCRIHTHSGGGTVP